MACPLTAIVGVAMPVWPGATGVCAVMVVTNAEYSPLDTHASIPVTSTAETQRTQTAGRKYMDDIIEVPFVYESGHLLVPDGPGLGISVDEEKLRKYRIN